MVISKDTAGFTFIEVVITVLILLIILSFSFRVYGDFNFRKNLEGEAKRFVETLELTKKKAAAVDKSGVHEGCIISGYKVTYTASFYRIFALCPSPVAVSGSISVASGHTLSGDGSGEVIFKPFGQGAQAACIIVQSNQSGRCRIVSVSTSGSVTYGDELSDCSC